MGPTKERKSEMSGTDETVVKGESFSSGDSVPRPLGFNALMPSQFV
jgi:hypothetical protein